jgi:hypothetical protein
MTNLPSPRTSFAARRGELEEIERVFADPDCRLYGPWNVVERLALRASSGA